MSRGLARIGDRTFGVCSHPSHPSPIPIGGTITTGTPTVTGQATAVARMGDTVITDCGHTDLIISGSATVTSAGLGVARIGDSVGALGIYTATIISGAPLGTAP